MALFSVLNDQPVAFIQLKKKQNCQSFDLFLSSMLLNPNKKQK